MVNGQPALVVDGRLTPAMAYTTYFTERNCYRAFAKAGYKIFFVNASFTSSPINSFVTGFTPFRVGVFEDMSKPDFSEYEDSVREILSVCPDAMIFPRLHVSMPRWWCDENPEETIDTKKGGRRELLFSKKFRSDGKELIRTFVNHAMSSDYAKSIAGWQICGGQTQEWFFHDSYGGLSDNALRYYKEYCFEKSGITDAKLPTKEDFVGDGRVNGNENARRYADFCNEGVAKSIDAFAGTVKELTGFKQIVGVFYGYATEAAYGGTLGGSNALCYLLKRESVDFFSSPNAYTAGRPFGIDWADMLPVDTVKLHGKLAFIECDIRTYLTKAVQECRPGEYPDDIYRTDTGASVWAGPPTPELSRVALRKCFAHQLTKGSAIWWFDMWGGWYDDPLLMKELKDCYGIAEKTPRGAYPSAEVALLADEKGYSRMAHGTELLSSIHKTRTSMGLVGAPYDTYLVDDIDSLIGRYKAFVFLSFVDSDEGERAKALLDKSGIPYLSPTPEHPSLTPEEIRALLSDSRVHFYSELGEVVYAGNGHVALHSAKKGEKVITLREKCKVKALLGAELQEEVTDILKFGLEENSTALFSIEKM